MGLDREKEEELRKDIEKAILKAEVIGSDYKRLREVKC